MEPVKRLSGMEFEKGSKTLSEKVLEYFDDLGNSVYSEELGDIALTKSSVRSELRHGLTRNKITSFAALQETIQNGKVIDVFQKPRGAERVVIAAPITIAGKKFYMGVMLQRDSANQRLYLHDVITEEAATSTSGDDLITTGSAEGGNDLYISNIIQNALNVKDGDTRFRLAANQYDALTLEYALEEDAFNDAQLANLAGQLRDHGVDLSDAPDTQELLEAVDMLVVINGTKGYMGVTVNKNGNHFYAERVILPNGTAYVFPLKAKETSQGTYQGGREITSLANTTSDVSKRSIPHPADEVKNSLPTTNSNVTSRQVHAADLRSREKGARLGKRMLKLNPDGTKRLTYNAVDMEKFTEGDPSLSRKYRKTEKLLKALGVRAVWYVGDVRRIESGKELVTPPAANGMYGSKTILLNAAAIDNAYDFTFGHELWHHVAKNNPGAVKQLYKFYQEHMEENGKADELQGALQKIADRYGWDMSDPKDAENAFEEYIANRFGEILSDEQFANRVMAKNGTLWQRICEAVRSFLDRLTKGGISDMNGIDALEAYMLQLTEDQTGAYLTDLRERPAASKADEGIFRKLTRPEPQRR